MVKTGAHATKEIAKLLCMKQYRNMCLLLREEVRRREKEDVKWWNEDSLRLRDQIKIKAALEICLVKGSLEIFKRFSSILGKILE